MSELNTHVQLIRTGWADACMSWVVPPANIRAFSPLGGLSWQRPLFPGGLHGADIAEKARHSITIRTGLAMRESAD